MELQKLLTEIFRKSRFLYCTPISVGPTYRWHARVSERVVPSGTGASPSGFVSAGKRQKLRGDVDPSGAAPLGRGGGYPSGCVPSGGRSNSRLACSFPGSASASLRVRRGRHGGLRVPSGTRGLRRENPLARGEGRDERSRCGRRVGLSSAIPREGDTAPRLRGRPFTGAYAGRDGRKPGPSRAPRSFGSRGVRSVPPGHVAWVLAYAPDASLNFVTAASSLAARRCPARAAHLA